LISPDRILRRVNILTFGRLPASGQQTILSQPHQESVRRFFEELARYLAPSGPAIQPEQPFSKFGRLFVALVPRAPLCSAVEFGNTTIPCTASAASNAFTRPGLFSSL
jgi:hypothetical protein